MEQTLPVAQNAAIAFTRTLRRADLAAILDFDSPVKVAQSFTNDIPSLETAIRAAAPGGSTALFNAVYIALKELSRLPAQDNYSTPRRRAIVVLSDGDDTSSLVDFDAVLDLRPARTPQSIPLASAGATHPLRSMIRVSSFCDALPSRLAGARSSKGGQGTVGRVHRHSEKKLSSVLARLPVGGWSERWSVAPHCSARQSPNVTVRYLQQGYFAPGK